MLWGAILGLFSGAAGGALLILLSEDPLWWLAATAAIFGAPIGLGAGALAAAVAVGVAWLLGRSRVSWVLLFVSAVVIVCLPQVVLVAIPGPDGVRGADLLLPGIGAVLALPAALGVARLARPRTRTRPRTRPREGGPGPEPSGP